MATLVSPGVSVTVTDQSYFVPASAPTVPLIVLATRENKPQDPTNPSSPIAPGTQENNVVRTITSLSQSQSTFGVPYFQTTNGQPNHGDARNEYGLAALNMFMGQGNYAYTVRANVNLDDNFTDLQALWTSDIDVATSMLENLVSQWIAQYNTNNMLSPSDPSTPASKTLTYTPAFTGATPITSTDVGKATITIDDTIINASITLSGTATVSAFLTTLNTALGVSGTATLVGGNIVITSTTIGSSSSVSVVDATVVGGIIALGSIVPGTGYTNGTYANTPLTGGSGSGAQATIVVAGNIVTSVTVTTAGINYVDGDVISATVPGGTGFAATVTSITVPLFFSVGADATPASTVVFQTSVPGTSGYKVTIDHVSLLALIQSATAFIWEDYSFGIPTTPTTLEQDFMNDQTALPFAVYANGFAAPSTGSFIGIQGLLLQWYSTLEGGTVAGEFTAAEAGNLLTEAGDQFEWTNNFLFKTSLGTDDASRRAAIVEALIAVVNSNQDIRAETIEYNLVLCPGYPELSSPMQALVINYLRSEVLVIGDTPMNDNPDDLATWAGSAARVIDVAGNIAYYYPHILTTNLDGTTILAPSSAQALTTYAYSDNVSYEWFAPAGVNRGKIAGITDLGYCTGVLGTATAFVTLHPNPGQRDVMYAYTASGGLNPLVFFPGNGFLVWGQKTSTGTTATALDRVNVSRLVKYIARALRKAALPFVFEPNDTLTQNNLKAMVDNFLGTLVTQRGLYDYATICDSSNNTPTVIDNNQLIIDVALKPVKAAEFIYIPITIVATGASLNTAGASQSV